MNQQFQVALFQEAAYCVVLGAVKEKSIITNSYRHIKTVNVTITLIYTQVPLERKKQHQVLRVSKYYYVISQ